MSLFSGSNMNSIKWNVVWNLFASIWLSCLNIALVPLFIRFIGIEAYGLVGFLPIQAALNLLDFGLSRHQSPDGSLCCSTRKARSARFSADAGSGVLGFGVVNRWRHFLLSYFMAYYWLQTVQLPASGSASHYVDRLGAACHGLFLSGGLQGLQKQVLLSKITICAITFRFWWRRHCFWLVSDDYSILYLA